MRQIWCAVLVAALALVLTACGGSPAAVSSPSEPVVADGDTVGRGSTSFLLEITSLDGSRLSVTVRTDRATVGEALQELGIISGEEGAYGLYILSVNGTVLDYDRDGAYWSFYVDDAYATAGVDKTVIDPAVTYGLKAERA